MPEGFTPDGDIEIELSILYGVSVYYQNENNVYWAHVATPENRGIFRFFLLFECCPIQRERLP